MPEISLLMPLIPITKAGIEAEAGGDFLIFKFLPDGDPREKWFSTRNGIVLGENPAKGEPGKGAFAEWVFDLSELPDNLAEVYLKIVTFRTHGGLHSKPEIAEEAIRRNQPKQGQLFINGQMVDGVNLMKPMSHGLDYGFNRLDPYPITLRVKECQREGKPLKIKLEVDPLVRWDVDWVKIRPFVSLSLDNAHINKVEKKDDKDERIHRVSLKS